MPLQPKFLSETPRKVKTSSIPRQVKCFEVPKLKESFHSELLDSIFDEGALPDTYHGDIIADCWFPDSILPLVPDANLLAVLTGPDGRLLYDSLTKQWAPQYLPPILHRAKSWERQRLAPGLEEKDLSAFMTIIMEALVRHRNSTLRESAPSSLSNPTSVSLNMNTDATVSSPIATTPPAISILRESAPSFPISLPSISLNPDSVASSPAIATSPASSILRQSASPISPPSVSLDTYATVSSPDTSIPRESVLSSPISLPDTSPHHIPASSSMSGTARRHPTETFPRLWSSAATQPLLGAFHLKPDSILIRQPADGTAQKPDWTDVLMTAELTSRQQTLNLTSQIECRALAMFDAQPDRAFTYSLSFHGGQYRLYMYDRAGGVYSRSYDLHESPVPFLRILCAATFAPTSYLGVDDTFDCRLHPVITIDGKQYFIIARCFSSSIIRGRATTVWFVSDSVPPRSNPKNIFVIKDSWVNVERQLQEEDILNLLKDVDCVPKVEKAWTVKRDGQDDSTSLRRPTAFMSHFKQKCDHRARRRLVLTPAGRPITHAANPLEVVTCLLDLVIAHRDIWARGILHRDISINNSMMYEEELPDGSFRIRGLLIDFDYAIRVDELNRTAGPGDRTGTLPFMAIEHLRTDDDEPLRHTVAHDLESFVYLLCWIVTFYAGPHSQLRDDFPKKLAMEGWYEGNDLAMFANNKEGCMSSGSHLQDITGYYESLRACVKVLSSLVHEQQQYVQRHSHNALTAQADYLTGSKRPLIEDSKSDPLNHNALISILFRTCQLLHKGRIPDTMDYEPRAFCCTKDHRTPLLRGGRLLKKKRIMHRKRGVLQTAS
ncbi:hypothetical protein J3R82DRAFT_9219 [Butyriboletus roseoflavus]|nr:hypothetical protein J3R82DRAFT_9219 [Butyriboletus roseoflavus]